MKYSGFFQPWIIIASQEVQAAHEKEEVYTQNKRRAPNKWLMAWPWHKHFLHKPISLPRSRSVLLYRAPFAHSLCCRALSRDDTSTIRNTNEECSHQFFFFFYVRFCTGITSRDVERNWSNKLTAIDMQFSSWLFGNFTMNFELAFSSLSFNGRKRHTTLMLSSAAISRSADIFDF